MLNIYMKCLGNLTQQAIPIDGVSKHGLHYNHVQHNTRGGLNSIDKHEKHFMGSIIPRAPSTSSEGTWTLQAHLKHLLRSYLEP